MKVYKLAYTPRENLRQWLLNNIGSYGDTRHVGFDNTLTIVKDTDATYFQLVFIDKVRDNKFYYDEDRYMGFEG